MFQDITAQVLETLYLLSASQASTVQKEVLSNKCVHQDINAQEAQQSLKCVQPASIVQEEVLLKLNANSILIVLKEAQSQHHVQMDITVLVSTGMSISNLAVLLAEEVFIHLTSSQMSVETVKLVISVMKEPIRSIQQTKRKTTVKCAH